MVIAFIAGLLNTVYVSSGCFIEIFNRAICILSVVIKTNIIRVIHRFVYTDPPAIRA